MKDVRAIFLVEDNEDDVILVRRALAKAGVTAEVHVSRNAEEAIRDLEAIGDGPLPTLVLLDLKLPGRSGHELLGWIRAHARLRTLPVVIFTTSAEQTDVQQAYALGANSYLRKPATAQETVDLLRAIDRYWLDLNIDPPRIKLES